MTRRIPLFPPRRAIYILTVSLGLNSCFASPFTSKAVTTLGDLDVPLVADSRVLAEGKNISAFDPLSPRPMNITGPTGALSGSSIRLAPGALSIATDLIVEEAAALSDTSLVASLGLAADIDSKVIGAGLIIRPSAQVSLNSPLAISMPIASTGALSMRLASGYYAVFYKSMSDAGLSNGVIPSSAITISAEGIATFEGYFGAYWLAEVSRPIEARIEKTSSEPMMNKDHIAVASDTGFKTETAIAAKAAVAIALWSKITQTFDAKTRTVAYSATVGPERTLSNCLLEIYSSSSKAPELIAVSPKLSYQYAVASSDALTLLARYRCTDDQDRLTASAYSETLSIPKVASPAADPVVPSSNQAPVISAINSITLPFNANPTSVRFTVNDPDTANANISVKAISDQPAIATVLATPVTGTAGTYDLNIFPQTGAAGNCLVTIGVSDGFNVVSRNFIIVIQPPTFPTPALLLDADSIPYSAGSTVSYWQDSINAVLAEPNFLSPPVVSATPIGTHKALSFDGSNQGLQVSGASSPISGSSQFTVAVIFRPQTSGYGNSSDQWYSGMGIVEAEEPGETYDWGLSWSSENTMFAGIGSPDTTFISAPIAVAQAHLAIYAWNGSLGTQTLSIDGTLSSQSTSANLVRNNAPFLIGSVAGGNFFAGEISLVEIYATALSTSQLTTLSQSLLLSYGISP